MAQGDSNPFNPKETKNHFIMPTVKFSFQEEEIFFNLETPIAFIMWHLITC